MSKDTESKRKMVNLIPTSEIIFHWIQSLISLKSLPNQKLKLFFTSLPKKSINKNTPWYLNPKLRNDAFAAFYLDDHYIIIHYTYARDEANVNKVNEQKTKISEEVEGLTLCCWHRVLLLIRLIWLFPFRVFLLFLFFLFVFLIFFWWIIRQWRW